MKRLSAWAAGVVALSPVAAIACTISFTPETEPRAFRYADLVVVAKVRTQAFGGQGMGLREGEASAVVSQVLKGGTARGGEVRYRVWTGPRQCPNQYDTRPGQSYRLYLKRPKAGGLYEVAYLVGVQGREPTAPGPR
ncbi:hypothetical protein [Phenylobacterium kunshanense]|uniref:Lipoprotein n=1 Tax=Phenylobacterium kunshanense TaxID=1445034 RepID=A0A328BNB2_9CAUL|nr:hypothetical protein [Phenylobacterium kunshanense]RAK67434.1 hypothetical protein DJ019_05840 [Phenylobacterium kunshanense]